jgi:hypothetical protein
MVRRAAGGLGGQRGARGGPPCSTELAPEFAEREQRPRCLCIELAPTSARAPGEIAADIGAGVVGAAEELTRNGLDAQRTAVAVDHAHVGAILVKPHELVRPMPQAMVIVAGDPHVAREQRETTRAARQALGNNRQIGSLLRSSAARGDFAI